MIVKTIIFFIPERREQIRQRNGQERPVKTPQTWRNIFVDTRPFKNNSGRSDVQHLEPRSGAKKNANATRAPVAPANAARESGARTATGEHGFNQGSKTPKGL